MTKKEKKMKIQNVKCPNCGANLQIEEGKQNQFCPYCGNQIILEDEHSTTTTTNINHNSNSSHTYVDQAKVEKIKMEREIQLKKEEQKKYELENYKQTNKTLLIVWAVTLIVCLILGFVDNGFWAVLLIDLVIGAIIAYNRTSKKP